MKIKRVFSLLLSLLCLCTAAVSGTVFANADDTMPEFTDVTEMHPHYKAIMFCAENNFVNGKSETSFAPDDSLTREQLALIWARTFHVKRSPHTFSDVAQVKGGEADMAIIVLHGLGILNGVSNTEFGRYSSVTREQAITIAVRTYLPLDYEGKNADRYEDSESISDWAFESVSLALESDILDGVFSRNKLMPQNPITRGEVCQIIANIMDEGEDVTPTPEPSADASPEPSPAVSPEPSAGVSPEPSPTVSPEPSAGVSPEPSPAVSPEPSPDAEN